MNNEHQWIYEFYMAALADNRPDKLRLMEFMEEVESLSKENHEERLALCEQGLAYATQLNELWWVAFFGFWKCETLLYQKHDPEAALRVAAELVIETRKPAYRAFPFRVAIHLNFIAAYSKIDPIGYAPQIRAALTDPEMEWDAYESFYLIYWQLRTRFLTAMGEPEAVEVAWQHFSHACHFHATQDSASSHYIIYALVDLLNALSQFELEVSRAQTAELSQLGQELSRRDGNERLDAIFTMWRAVGARFASNESEAKRFARSAAQKQAALSPPRNAIFVAELAFHKLANESEKSLAVCDEAVEVAQTHAHWFDAATYLTRKCELLRELGRSCADDAARLRDVAARLPSRGFWEAKIRGWDATDSV